MPELMPFRQFDNLEVLILMGNNIRGMDFSLIPPTVTWLNLDNNQLTAVGDCSHCTHLSVLYVQSNHINHIDWRNLPPSLTQLRLNNNQVTTVDASHCSQLVWLDMKENPTLHSIRSIPNTDFHFFINSSSVKFLGRKCFHENTYNMLQRMCTWYNWKLEQPPVEVLLQGLESVLEYYTEKHIRTPHTR